MIMSDWTREYIKTHPIKALATIKGLGVVSDVQNARIEQQAAEIERLKEAVRVALFALQNGYQDLDVKINAADTLYAVLESVKEDS
jgi:hypothetical protein